MLRVPLWRCQRKKEAAAATLLSLRLKSHRKGFHVEQLGFHVVDASSPIHLKGVRLDNTGEGLFQLTPCLIWQPEDLIDAYDYPRWTGRT